MPEPRGGRRSWRGRLSTPSRSTCSTARSISRRRSGRSRSSPPPASRRSRASRSAISRPPRGSSMPGASAVIAPDDQHRRGRAPVRRLHEIPAARRAELGAARGRHPDGPHAGRLFRPGERLLPRLRHGRDPRGAGHRRRDPRRARRSTASSSARPTCRSPCRAGQGSTRWAPRSTRPSTTPSRAPAPPGSGSAVYAHTGERAARSPGWASTSIAVGATRCCSGPGAQAALAAARG